MKLEKELRTKLLPLLEELPPDRWEALQAEWRRRQLCVVVPFRPRRKRRFPRLLLCTVAAMTACGVLLCTPAGGAWLFGQDRTPAVSHTAGESVMADNIVVNEVKEYKRKHYNPPMSDIAYTKELDWDNLIDYLGYDIRPVDYPNDLCFRKDWVEQHPLELKYNQNGNVVAMQHNNFTYTSTGLSPRQLVIHYSKIKTPVSDRVYCLKDKNTESVQATINNIQVKIGYLLTKGKFDGFIDDMPTERYVAVFTVKGVYLQVTADNLTLEEFVAVIKSMIR